MGLSLAGLCSISKESRNGIRSILKELQEHHYVEIEKVRGEKGYFEYNYLIYETPHFIDLENEQNHPDMENPHLDIPNMETPTQINTNIINIKKQIDKDILKNYLSSSSPKQKFRNKQEIENAIRNINDEMEEAQKEFSKLFITTEYEK